MTKINSLLNYLIKNSFYEEANYLFKLANDQSPEEYLQENYPNIYAVSSNDHKPAAAYINIITQLKNKGYSDEQIKGFQIDNFQDLIKKLKEKKTDPKKEFLDEVKKQVEVNISDKELLYAKEKGLDLEETIFLVKDETAHPFSAKVDWAFKFNQNKYKHEDLRDKKITDYQNIDEVDRAITDKITYSAEYMKNFYEGIKDEAEENTDIIYNSLNYVVAHSMSKEAAQWWEQSCVSYNKIKKTVDAGLCTARHEDNLYDAYYSDGYLVQIITKSSPSTSTSPETNFKDKNYSWNLISLHILDNGGLSQEYGSTVNRLNQDVTPCEIKDALGDEYNEIIEAISNYFNKNFNTQISGFDCEEEDAPNILKLIKKDELNEKDIQFLEDLSSRNYFDYKLDIKFKDIYPEIFDKNYRDIGSMNYATFFENNLGKYRNENPEYFEIFIDALKAYDPSEYFFDGLDEKYKEDYPKIFEKKLKDIHNHYYFGYKVDEKYGEEFPEILKNKLENTYRAFYFQQNLDEKYAEKFPFIHISKHTLREYFEKKFDEKYPEGLPRPHNLNASTATRFDIDYPKDALIPIKDLLSELSSHLYFQFKLDEKYGEKYPDIYDKNMVKKLLDTPEETYFKLKLHEEYGEKYPGVLSIQLERIDKGTYFGPDRLDLKYGEKYPDIFYKKLEEVDVSVVENYLLHYLNEYNKTEYPNMFEKIFDFIIYELRGSKKDLLDKVKEIYPDKNAFKLILTHFRPSYYFYNNFDEEYKEIYPEIFENKIKMIPAENYFQFKLDEKYGEEYSDILKQNKEVLYNMYYSKYFEKNIPLKRHIAQRYYDNNIDKFFEKYYPELSEKIDNKFKELKR